MPVGVLFEEVLALGELEIIKVVDGWVGWGSGDAGLRVQMLSAVEDPQCRLHQGRIIGLYRSLPVRSAFAASDVVRYLNANQMGYLSFYQSGHIHFQYSAEENHALNPVRLTMVRRRS